MPAASADRRTCARDRRAGGAGPGAVANAAGMGELPRRTYSQRLALRESKSGPAKTGACGRAFFATNNAAHSASTLPKTRTGAAASKLRSTANMAPIQNSTGAAKLATGATVVVQNSSSAGYAAAYSSSASVGWSSGQAYPNAAIAASVRTESATTAASAVTRAGGGTNSAVITSAIAIHATTEFRPYGLNSGVGPASTNCSAQRTSARTTTQPRRVGRPTKRGLRRAPPNRRPACDLEDRPHLSRPPSALAALRPRLPSCRL